MTADPQVLTASQLATARSRAYRSLGLLFQHGLTEESIPAVRMVPELADQAPGVLTEHADFESLAANHYSLFGLNVFAHESIFLDQESNLGGPVAGEVAEFFHRAGFDFLLENDNPDHLARELALLAFLSSAEALAWEKEQGPAALRLRDSQRRFLANHLLRWLPGLSQAIRQQGEPFYTALAELTFELAREHFETSAEDMLSQPVDFHLPPSPDLLENEKTGLKDISRYLLTPAYSGMYLSRDDLSRLASGLGIPRGFGSRQQMLVNLLHAAADYEQLPTLIERLLSLLEIWIDFYTGWSGDGDSLKPFAAPWLERLGHTQTLLTRISAQFN
jgi:putative dimethyl sulfoxide reductase chaperone